MYYSYVSLFIINVIWYTLMYQFVSTCKPITPVWKKRQINVSFVGCINELNLYQDSFLEYKLKILLLSEYRLVIFFFFIEFL